MKSRKAPLLLAATCAAATALAFAAAPASAAGGGFTGPLTTLTSLASTTPANGDVNPYGVAVAPQSVGDLHRGDVLVSNFNSAANLQGTGTTIVSVDPRTHAVSTFATIDPQHLPGPCPGGVGLTTALTVLPGGWVVVGSLPTSDGTAATAQAGCLLVLDRHGHVRETFSGGGINGPWDMTSVSYGPVSELFVTNVLNGTVAAGGNVTNGGTVLRLTLVGGDDGNQAPRLVRTTVIGSCFPERTDPSALVVGPTGVGLGRDGTLYVADSVGNRIAAIRDALTRTFTAGAGRTVSSAGALNTPLGLTVAPGGDVLTVNAGDGNLVETTPGGQQVNIVQLDASGQPPGAGALFGLAVKPGSRAVYFVDDATNTLDLLS